MRVISAIVSILLTLPVLAQIGVRTGRPTTKGSIQRVESLEGQPPRTVTETIDAGNVAMAVDPADEDVDDEKECEVPTGFFPTRTKDSSGQYNTLCFWNQKGQEYLKYARFVNSSKTVSAATDVLSDAFGPYRIVLSTAVAASTDEDEETEEPTDGEGLRGNAEGDEDEGDEPTSTEDRALNLLSTNGGNLSITTALPIYYKPLGGGNFLWNTYVRVAGNVAAMGGGSTESRSEWDEMNANLELAFTELQADLLSQEKHFNIQGYLKTSAIAGTKKFNELIGNDGRNMFLHGQVGAGLRIADVMTVYATWNWYSADEIPGSGAAITFAMGK